jgi:hypothetical protein
LKERVRDDTGATEKVVTVLITGDWDEPGRPGHTEVKIWNAVNRAIARWNAADPTGPHIQLAQTEHASDVSVYITKKKLDRDTAAQIRINAQGYWGSTGPEELELRDDSLSQTDDDLMGRIEHEIGHGVKNLADTDPWLEGAPIPLPGSCLNSVMNESGEGGVRRPEFNTISSGDVNGAKTWRTNPKNCEKEAKATSKDAVLLDDDPQPLDGWTQQVIVRGGCTELWEYTNWWICFDGCQYLGTSFRRISPPCED